MRRSLRFALLLAPIFLLAIFLGPIASLAYIGLVGLYAFVQVLYLSITFNDCENASRELKKEIIEAKKEIFSKISKIKN